MATAREYCRYMGMELGDLKCIICGSPAAAVWVGEETVAVCKRCALEILPKLIADAVLNSLGDIDRFISSLEETQAVFNTNFYRACLMGLWRRVRDERGSEEVEGESEEGAFMHVLPTDDTCG